MSSLQLSTGSCSALEIQGAPTHPHPAPTSLDFPESRSHRSWWRRGWARRWTGSACYFPAKLCQQGRYREGRRLEEKEDASLRAYLLAAWALSIILELQAAVLPFAFSSIGDKASSCYTSKHQLRRAGLPFQRSELQVRRHEGTKFSKSNFLPLRSHPQGWQVLLAIIPPWYLRVLT